MADSPMQMIPSSIIGQAISGGLPLIHKNAAGFEDAAAEKNGAISNQ